MATYITQGNYTQHAMRGMVKNPEDRRAAVAALMKSVGGKLKDYYLTTGEYDFLLVFEADDLGDAVAGLMVAGASGSVTNLKTVQALSPKDAKATMSKAKKVRDGFRPAGGKGK